MPKMRTIPKLNSGSWLLNVKKPETVRIFCAYLVVASVAAVAIQVVALTAIIVGGVPEHVFMTLMFRLSAFAFCLGVIGLIRRVARRAFAEALVRDEVEFTDFRLRPISVSPTCKHRQLVILHMRLTGFSVDTNNQ